MKLTVYVPCHNGADTLPQVLQALREQSRPADRYLLINDRSRDDSVAIARRFGFEVRDTGPDHFGLGAGRNVALAHADADVLAGCDADAVPEPTFLEKLEHQFVTRPEVVGVCGCLQEKYSGESIFDLWRSIHMRQHYGECEVENPPILFGCSSAHRTDFVRQLGGWNPAFKSTYEDTDLTRRIYQAGGKTLYAPSCRIWHIRRDSLESVLRQYWFWNFPPANLSGIYDSLDLWRQGRQPWIWHEYRVYRVQDLATPQIALVTCLLPWTIIIRDLHQIYARRGRVIDLDVLAAMAERTMVQFGAHPGIANWMRNWLANAVIDTLPPLSGPVEPWDAGLLHELELGALLSIPDGNYWGSVQGVFSIQEQPERRVAS